MYGVHNFYLETNNKKIGEDGQCGSLVSLWFYKNTGKWFACSYTHLVKDYIEHFHDLGLDEYFDLIEVGDRKVKDLVQDGDVLYWPVYVKMNHVAICRNVWANDSQCVCLTQNTTPLVTNQQLLRCDHVTHIIRCKKDVGEPDYKTLYTELNKKYNELLTEIKYLGVKYDE